MTQKFVSGLKQHELKTEESLSEYTSYSSESEKSQNLLKKREIGGKVVPALKINIYDEKHPMHTSNRIKSIPLVKQDKNLENEEKFLKNL